jgi:hypothetical protein
MSSPEPIAASCDNDLFLVNDCGLLGLVRLLHFEWVKDPHKY